MRLATRCVVAVAATVLTATAVTGSALGSPSPADTDENSPVQVLPAPASALDTMLGTPIRTLRHGSPRSVGLLPDEIAKIPGDVESGMQPQGADNHPLFPGGVSLQGHDGTIVSDTAHGYSYLYSDDRPTLLPPDQRVRTKVDTIYDLASLSKLFTTVVSMQLVERGLLDLDAHVVDYLPAFASHGKSDITVRQLLTHTSGLQPDPTPALWQLPADQREAGILNTTPQASAGTTYVYSDLNMMTMQLIDQHLTGERLDTLVHDGITVPLHMTSTMYNPPAKLLPRIAAEEYQRVPDRGLVHGEVHDENAWALGGVAGHAGVFSDAHDLAIMAQTLLNGGTYDGARILSKTSVEALMTNLNQKFVGDNHGIGFELYQPFYMGALATPYTSGHTGFTGTDIVIDPTTDSFSILLTNRVHPSRNWGSINPVRIKVADDLARAMPVPPVQGRTSWYAGMVDASTAALQAPLPAAKHTAHLGFAMQFDTEPDADLFTLEQSSDGSTWTKVPYVLHDGTTDRPVDGTISGYGRHRWWRATATLARGTTALRWTYTTDPLYHGLGVRVDAIRAIAAGQTLFDTARSADENRVVATGFVPSPN